MRCPDNEHDWERIRDWIGDPGVVNGTMTVYYRRCRTCSLSEDDPDYDWTEVEDDGELDHDSFETLGLSQQDLL